MWHGHCALAIAHWATSLLGTPPQSTLWTATADPAPRAANARAARNEPS